ncbi:MAG: HesA/MoeB/ThiF family protein [Pseudomonadota bacterium]
MNESQRERYARHLLLREVGGQGQQKLLNAKVLIVGAGGLGAPIIQYLAAAGVGELGIADDDVVSLSNLQRQVLYGTDDVGRPKVEAAADFIARLNSDVRVNALACRIDAENAAATIDGYDLVIEGVDNFESRYALNTACIAARVPFLSAAIGRFEGQISLYKPFAAPGRLPCYRCFVPQEPPRESQVNCAEEGVLGAVAGVVGAAVAMEALKELLGLGDSLAGRIMLFDGLSGRWRNVALKADQACTDCSDLDASTA